MDNKDLGRVVPTGLSSDDGAGQAVSTLTGFDPSRVIVPLDAPESMWDGLPRQIMVWLSCERPTPRALFEHMRLCGYEVPDWMREEGELKALDHVPSKGTRCVLIYRAMIENWLASLAAARSFGLEVSDAT